MLLALNRLVKFLLSQTTNLIQMFDFAQKEIRKRKNYKHPSSLDLSLDKAFIIIYCKQNLNKRREEKRFVYKIKFPMIIYELI